MFFAAQAVTPKKLTREQRAAFEQLANVLLKEEFKPRPHRADGAEGAANAAGDDKNLFDKVKDIFG